MKKLGITRPIDRMGRIVIPRELRRSLGLEYQDRLEVFADGDTIVLKKSSPRCSVCGGTKHLTSDGKICAECIKKYSREMSTLS